MSKKGLSLLREVSLDGPDGHCRLGVGATLTFPDELELRAADGALLRLCCHQPVPALASVPVMLPAVTKLMHSEGIRPLLPI